MPRSDRACGVGHVPGCGRGHVETREKEVRLPVSGLGGASRARRRRAVCVSRPRPRPAATLSPRPRLGRGVVAAREELCDLLGCEPARKRGQQLERVVRIRLGACRPGSGSRRSRRKPRSSASHPPRGAGRRARTRATEPCTEQGHHWSRACPAAASATGLRCEPRPCPAGRPPPPPACRSRRSPPQRRPPPPPAARPRCSRPRRAAAWS